jgi:CheY-like chemotaxis protein
MLMGGVKPRAADIQLPPRERSTRAGPLTTALAAPSPTKSGSVSSAPKPVGESSGSKLLVIEDDPVIRDMVVRVLARENLVYQASDGAKGLALLKKIGSVDVIVCDVMMPHLDGFEFAEAAKADPILTSIPILFLTARDSAKDRLEGIRVGARSYLTKPFKVKDLTLAVARAARSATVKR